MADYEAAKTARLDPVLDEFTEDDLAGLARLMGLLSARLLAADGELQGSVCLRCTGYYDPQCPLRRLGVRCPYARSAGRPA